MKTRLAELRHAGVGDRAALHGADRAPLRAAVPVGRRAQRVDGGRRAGRLRVADDDAADVPRRHELRHALGRLARGRARVELREVHRRHRAPADAQARVQAARGDRGEPRLRRARGGRLAAGTSSAPRTRCCTSATASTGRCCRRPTTSTAGRRTAGWTRRRAPRRSGARRSRRTSSRRSTTACATTLRDYVARRRIELGDEPVADAGVLSAGARAPRLPLAHAGAASRPTT